jgi:hypothetical protein
MLKTDGFRVCHDILACRDDDPGTIVARASATIRGRTLLNLCMASNDKDPVTLL